jgi:hypothetical protein
LKLIRVTEPLLGFPRPFVQLINCNERPFMVANYNEIEKRLWHAADELRANSKLRASQYSVPVLG